MATLQNPPEKKVYFERIALLKKKAKNRTVLWLFFGLVCLIGIIGLFHYRIKKIEVSQKQLRKVVKTIYQHTPLDRRLGGLPVPMQLQRIPFGEEQGIILDVIEVPIRDVTAPYNPAILKTPNGYDLFFRYDLFQTKLKYASFSSNIGVVALDHRFKQQERTFKRIDLQTSYGDDPRVLLVKDQIYLFYNRLDENNPRCRHMCVANLKPDTYEMNYNTVLDMNLSSVEKNWSPFEYIGSDQKPHLFLEYRINPRKVIELIDPQVNDLKNIPVPGTMAYLDLKWGRKWGEIRGGTPSLRIGDEYLGFFHSWFMDERKFAWYVMGAYTFSAEPPFHVTSISPHPILFKGIYETALINTASCDKRVIFPSGFLIGEQEGREQIYLACGENDSGVKIVILDKKNLLNNMVRF